MEAYRAKLQVQQLRYPSVGVIRMTIDEGLLQQRIALRVDGMMEAGLEQEARALFDRYLTLTRSLQQRAGLLVHMLTQLGDA